MLLSLSQLVEAARTTPSPNWSQKAHSATASSSRRYRRPSQLQSHRLARTSSPHLCRSTRTTTSKGSKCPLSVPWKLFSGIASASRSTARPRCARRQIRTEDWARRQPRTTDHSVRGSTSRIQIRSGELCKACHIDQFTFKTNKYNQF